MPRRLAVVIVTGLAMAGGLTLAPGHAATATSGGASPGGTGRIGSTGYGDLPPTVKLTSPNSTSIYGEPGVIPISATAGDPDGAITKVVFSTAPYSGFPFTPVATITGPPWTYRLTTTRVDVFYVRATAYDDAGLTATDTVRLRVAVVDPVPTPTPGPIS